MPIQYTDQLNLLKDILQNQQEDCCGSVSEYEQIERLVKALMVSGHIDQEAISILNEIYSYGQNGKYTQNSERHIETHQNELNSWVSQIDQFR